MEDDDPAPLAPADGGQIISSVGFIGQATGVIYLNANVSFAKCIASRMLGLDEAEVDGGEMINDVFGELGNVVVGSVKSRLCDLGWSCTLTIPSIVRGNELSVEAVTDATRIVLGFRAGDQRLIAEVLIKNHLA
jgi:chemotaxis protein CheX